MSASIVTLAGKIGAGTIVPPKRVTVDDLLLAIDVLGAYEPDDEDEGATHLAAVIQFPRAEVRRRDFDAFSRNLTHTMKRRGIDVTTPAAIRLIRRTAREKCPSRKDFG